MSTDAIKMVDEFMDAVGERMKSMRNEIRNELLLEMRSALPDRSELKGDPGERGPEGKDGAPGPNGKDGRDGVDGKHGADGVSVVDVAVKDGDLWVTLSNGAKHNAGRVVGPQGEKGDPGERGKDGAPGERGERGEPGRDGKDGADGLNGKDGADGLNGKDGAPGERGERGEKGMDGRDGQPGRDGVKGDPGRDGKDGITFQELEDGVARVLRSIEVRGRKWKIGEREVDIPIPEYKGVWKPDAPNEKGDFVTFGGAVWHCNAATTAKPGDGNEDWTLAVKSGRDGKDATGR
jgi:collagen type III alpha